MDDLVLVEVVHPGGDLLGPLHQPLGRHVPAVPEQVEEGAVRAVLHHDAEHRGLDTDAPGEWTVSRKSTKKKCLTELAQLRRMSEFFILT